MCVGVYGLIHSLYHPRDKSKITQQFCSMLLNIWYTHILVTETKQQKETGMHS